MKPFLKISILFCLVLCATSTLAWAIEPGVTMREYGIEQWKKGLILGILVGMLLEYLMSKGWTLVQSKFGRLFRKR